MVKHFIAYAKYYKHRILKFKNTILITKHIFYSNEKMREFKYPYRRYTSNRQHRRGTYLNIFWSKIILLIDINLLKGIL